MSSSITQSQRPSAMAPSKIANKVIQDPSQGTFLSIRRSVLVADKPETQMDTVILSDNEILLSEMISPEHSPTIHSIRSSDSRRSSITMPPHSIDSIPEFMLPPAALSSAAPYEGTEESKKYSSDESDKSDKEEDPKPPRPSPAMLPADKPSTWNKIPLLLELYCHLRRLAQALIQNERTQKSVVDNIWLKITQEILKDLSGKPARSNHETAEHRMLYSKRIEKNLAFEIKVLNLNQKPEPNHQPQLNHDWKSRLKERVAGNFNLLFINSTLRLKTLISPPEYGQSSHSKKTMPPAVMKMTHTFSPVASEEKIHSHYRCPSIQASTTQSVAENLALALENIPGSAERLTNYNLLTSLPKVDKNHQGKTAADLLQAAHTLNKVSPTPRVLIFNIPVNQHTELLTYKRPWFSAHKKTIPEALVMADLAVIFKIGEWKSAQHPKWLPRIQEIKAAYQAFLRTYNPKKPSYFSEYTYIGEKIVNRLSFIKKALLDETIIPKHFSSKGREAHRELMERAFLKLYCTKYDGNLTHLHKDQHIYGLTTQALFAALDDNNLIGCKSANERFFLTEGLIQTLQAFMEGTLPPKTQAEMQEKFQAFLQNEKDCPPPKFIEFLMKTDNDLNVYGSAIGPSLLDTGTPKCDMDNHDPVRINALNTNVFAPGIFSNLYHAQKGVSELQAHNDALAHRMEHCLGTVHRADFKTARLLLSARGMNPTESRLNDPDEKGRSTRTIAMMRASVY